MSNVNVFGNIFETSNPFSFSTSSDPFQSGNSGDDSCSSGTDYQSFSGSDCGDPHLSDSYTTEGGVSGTQKWDDMSGISDLLSGSQFGGFQYSTGVTTPNQNNVTLNDEFNAKFGNGSSIDMNTSGAPEININGTAQQMQVGQTYHINGSTTATWDGSKLTVSQHHGNSSLTTTVANNGGHLDITSSGSDDQLSGALTGNQTPANTVPFQPTDNNGNNGDPNFASQNNQWQKEISSLESLIANLQSLMQQQNASSMYSNSFGQNNFASM